MSAIAASLERSWRQRARAWLAFFRPADWWYFLALPFLSTDRVFFTALGVVQSWLVGAGILGFAYGLNTLKDEGPRSQHPNGTWEGLAFLSVTMLRGGLIACLVATAMLALTMGSVAAVATAIALVSGALYSGRPRLKRWPVIGSLTNVAIFAPLGLLGQPARPLSTTIVLFLGVFSLLLLQNQLIHEASHADDDAAEGLRTTFLVLGERVTRWASVVCGVVAAALTVLLATGQAHSLRRAVVMLPMLLFSGRVAWLGLHSDAVARRLRTQHRWLSFVVGALVWFFLSEVPDLWW